MKHELTKVIWSNLESMKDWSVLSTEEQRRVIAEDRGLQEAVNEFGLLKAEVGKRFSDIKDVLSKHRMWENYLECRGLMPFRRSIYRYIKSHRYMEESVQPSLRLKAAKMGMNMYGFSAESPLGEYGRAMKDNPPPQTEDPKKQEQYLLKLQSIVRAARRDRTKSGIVDKNYDELVKESFRLIRPRLQRIDKRSRMNALEELFGMLLSSMGGKSAMTVKPKPVPAGFIVPRGRPRKQDNRPRLAAA